MPTASRKPIARLALVLVVLLAATFSAFFVVPTKVVKADPANDYPSSLAEPVPQDSVTDPWGFYNRECTSFVAWRLNNNNSIPFQNNNYLGKGMRFGNAQDWGSVAKSIGITVDTTPAVGAVAWWYFSSTSGHVAWVAAINADGSVQVQDYNWGYPTNPGLFLDHKLTSAPTGYIHFAGSSTPTPTPTPAPPIIALKSARSPDGSAIEVYAATANRVTQHWYYNGGTSGTTDLIDQANIVGIDKLNQANGTESLYTAVPDGVYETWWNSSSNGPQTSKIVYPGLRGITLSGVRGVIAENTIESGITVHHLYILVVSPA